jgi:hypothetical protein
MAIDQRDVSSTLRFMDDRALQQYAAMHKSDPYIFPLAFQKSQNRQRLRMNQQAAQGMQPQPKVADQALAQMAPQPMPEEQGIGALPAGNMQQMADGGIAGYPDDANFAERSEPVVMMAGGGHVPRYQGNPQDGSVVRARGPYDQPPASMTGDIPGFVAGTSIFQTQPSADPEEPFLRRLLRERKEAVEAQRVQEARARAMKGQPLSAEDQARIANADKAKTVADTSAQDLAQFDAASNLYMTERAGKQAAAKPAPTADNKTAPRPDTARRPAPAAGLGAAAAAAAPKDDPFSMATIRKAQTEAMGDSNYKIGELNNQLVDIRNRAETQVQQRLEDRKKEIESEGDVYKDRSDRLVERAKGLAGQKDQNTGLALLNAGLAIMSTPGGLMTAIGKGAQVGTAQYAAGIKDLRAAQERLDEANDRISELRMNRKDLNNREIRALEKDRDSAILDGQKMIFGFAKDIYGMDRKQAEAAFASYMSGQEKKATIDAERENTLTRERGANARNKASTDAALQSPERMAFMSALEKTKTKANPQGDAAAAYQSVVAMKREPVSMEKLRGDWLDPAKRMQIAQDYPNVKTFDDYAVVMGAGGGRGAGGDGLRVVGVR